MGQHMNHASGETGGIQWHPGFYSAFEREFRRDRAVLEFKREVSLTKGPLFMDMLVIKLLGALSAENEIGSIFRTYNVCEYKSPEDALTIDDYYKTVAYACLYKSAGETVNAIPAQEITLSLIRNTLPRELFHALEQQGLKIAERFPGVYYLEGNPVFPTQILVTSRLNRETHSGLRVLTRNAEEEDVRRFLEEALLETEPGDRANVDAILQVSVSANQALYESIRRDSIMCQALRELMKDEIKLDLMNSRQEGWREGRREGRRDHSIETARRMLAAGRYQLDEIAVISGLSLEEVQSLQTS